MNESIEVNSKQLLHLVIGGPLKGLKSTEFKDVSAIDVVGVFPSYKAAYDVWRQKAQQTVDDAETRYFIVHIHRLMDPSLAE